MNDYYNYEQLKKNIGDFCIGKDQGFLFSDSRINFEDFKKDLSKLECEKFIKVITTDRDINTGVISATIKRLK